MTIPPIDPDVFRAIEQLVEREGQVASGPLARSLGVSRQAAHGHLVRAVELGVLERVGAGRGTRYVRPTLHVQMPIRGLDEERVWDAISPALLTRFGFTDEARQRAHYAVTEMVNNAIDHASASSVTVDVSRSASGVRFVIADDGVGAIRRAREGLEVQSDVEVIAELSKGKRTTAPARHSGEGLFFTSKTVRTFKLEANGFAWVVDTSLDDEGIAVSDVVQGTRVTFVIDPTSHAPLADVFRAWTTNDAAFSKTRARIKLLAFGVDLISRAQAKRVVARLEAFAEVELDFHGVVGVGQGFVDEVFRVWAADHPQTRLEPSGMNEAVRFMVERGLGGGEGERGASRRG